MQSNRKKAKKTPNLIKSLLCQMLKQTVAALLCLLIALGMHTAKSTSIRAYADALGRAMRHESDFSQLLQIGGDMTDKLKGLFSSREERSL